MAETYHLSESVLAQIELPSQAYITEYDLELLFIHLLRCPDFFMEARAHLTQECFYANLEYHFSLLWVAMTEVYDHFGYIQELALFHCIQNKSHNNSQVTPDQRVWLTSRDGRGFVQTVAWVGAAELVPDYARTVLQRFLRERLVMAPLRHIMSTTKLNPDKPFPEDFEGLLATMTQRLQRVNTVNVLPIAGEMPPFGAALPPPAEYFATNISFIDNYIGGQRPGDANGILGPYGSGKTTVLVQLAVSLARRYHLLEYQRATVQRINWRGPLSVLLTYEEPESKINPRIWANAAEIPRRYLEQLTDWNDLSTPGQLKEYERELYANLIAEGVPTCSERERWEINRAWLNDHFILLDMSGSEKFPNAGTGYIDEVVAALEKVAAIRNRQIGTVAIDYAGLMARRHMSANNVNEDKLRHYLGGMGDAVRRKISEHFGCTTWIGHQMAGSQNRRNATALLHHADAAEAKNFAENLAVCGCLGVMDPQTGCLLLNWSKVRYNAERSLPAPTLRIDGVFGRMEDVSRRFVPDRGTRRFSDPSELHQIDEAVGPVRPQRGPVGISSNRVTDSLGAQM